LSLSPIPLPGRQRTHRTGPAGSPSTKPGHDQGQPGRRRREPV